MSKNQIINHITYGTGRVISVGVNFCVVQFSTGVFAVAAVTS